MTVETMLISAVIIIFITGFCFAVNVMSNVEDIRKNSDAIFSAIQYHSSIENRILETYLKEIRDILDKESSDTE